MGASDKRQKLEVAVVVSNGDLELLQYARKLLAETGFHPADARLNHPAGKVTNLSVATQDNHLVTLGRFGEMRTFQEKIGFADSEKNAKLEEAISLIDELGPFAAAEKWRELYVKAGGKWVRRIASRLAPHGDDSATLK